MSTDEGLRSDAQQLEALLEGRASESDPAVRAVFERRPEWREVFEHARKDAGESAPWSGETSEADRRFVAECLAQARAPAVRSAPAIATPPAPIHSVRRPWTRWLALAAAMLVVGWLARLWLAGEEPPVRPKGALLESNDPLHFFETGGAPEGYSRFEWTSKGLAQGELFVLTIWGLDSSGARAAQLLRKQTDASYCDVSPEESATWPERVIWRVARTDSQGIPGESQEWFAERSPR